MNQTNENVNTKPLPIVKQQDKDEPKELVTITKAKDLIKHSFTITNSTDRYPKKYRFTLVNKIQNKVIDIYECLLEANELNVMDRTEKPERLRLQRKAVAYIKELLYFIEFSLEMKFIDMNSCKYWSKLAVDLKYLVIAWRNKDKQR